MGPLLKQPSNRATSWAVSMNSGSQGHWKKMKYQDLHTMAADLAGSTTF